MKNAPNLKYQPKDKFTEVIIFAGTDAYAHAQHWIESEGRKHGDNVPPVYLGPKQLADLANIRIVDDERRFARVYLAGEIEPIQINAIAEKLALAGAGWRTGGEIIQRYHRRGAGELARLPATDPRTG